MDRAQLSATLHTHLCCTQTGTVINSLSLIRGVSRNPFQASSSRLQIEVIIYD